MGGVLEPRRQEHMGKDKMHQRMGDDKLHHHINGVMANRQFKRKEGNTLQRAGPIFAESQWKFRPPLTGPIRSWTNDDSYRHRSWTNDGSYRHGPRVAEGDLVGHSHRTQKGHFGRIPRSGDAPKQQRKESRTRSPIQLFLAKFAMGGGVRLTIQ